MESYNDIPLRFKLKGENNVMKSFDEYVSPEILDDDNMFNAGEFGWQRAEKGDIFASFPPILHLHLIRYRFDKATFNSVKICDRFEFYEKMNLDKYLDKPEETPANYVLHAVLVHSGGSHGGHYVVFIDPRGDGNWFKFDDDVVSAVSKAEAIDQNYGGSKDDSVTNARSCSNAYVLVYIRESEMKTILQEITAGDVPTELFKEKHMEMSKRYKFL